MIARVTAQLLRVPLPLFMHGFGYQYVNVPYISVHDSDGRRGTGFTYTLDAGASVVCAMVDEVIAPALEGSTVDDWNDVRIRVLANTRRLGATTFIAAVSAVDIAIWDLRGVATGLPLVELLGGSHREVLFYGSGRSGQDLTTDELVQHSLDYLDEGFNGVKLGVGVHSIDTDVSRIATVREALGESTPLMVDASERFTRTEALDLGGQLEGMGVQWFEEPLMSEDVEGYALLARELGTSIAAGEHFQEVDTFERYARETGTEIFQPDAALGGGITAMLKVAAVAAGSGRRIAWHSLADLHIHLASSTAGSCYVEDFPILENIIGDPLRPKDGAAIAPSRPGHGIRWDAGAIREFTVGV
ncbi:mandelate racemase/muconate lactonizing enzyme family protein [Parafrigoribacterium humi]|jgi:L-alanine-DL-glutamate epimerase-like enolase superfamily enzyme|uniref:mandelate racemase/muconate lactonizing enzyme family protein n=1 Tax=Parafrigoribacterium humi TaxID=3144664 RepID=UPI0032EE5008